MSEKKPRKARESTKGRGPTMRLFPNGDFVVLRISAGTEDGAPAGCLMALEPERHFEDTYAAKKWLKSGESGQGRFAIVKFCSISNLRPKSVQVCELDEAPRAHQAPPKKTLPGEDVAKTA